MNDANSAFSSPLSPDLSQLSHISFPTLNVDQIRLALNLSAASPLVPPRHLPSYSYSSFASSLATYPSSINSDNDTVEWKWRLFEFIRVSHENRHDPSEGYLCNPQMDALVSLSLSRSFRLPALILPVLYPFWIFAGLLGSTHHLQAAHLNFDAAKTSNDRRCTTSRETGRP